MAQRVDTVTVTIRTSKELHKWLVQEAKANNRSLNREIEYKLMKLKEAGEADEEKPARNDPV
jgi:predicted HicB family RNase H-like nuclease